MNNISFKNRIALYFSISTALLVLVVFVVIYYIVKSEVYQDLDNDLDTEVKVLLDEIAIDSSGFQIADEEWEEKEHKTLDINPIFIQFIDIGGNIFAKSPNLKDASLYFKKSNNKAGQHYNSFLNGAAVRQYHIAVPYKNSTVGYIVVATPMEDAGLLLKNLQNILVIAYPTLLAILFSIARLLAGKSIKPIQHITNTSAKITKENLSSRIPLPYYKDELFTLSKTINALLQRIEDAVSREKQFTSDASHELRTPLAVIKGTLEVLLRKPRSGEEYVEKIKFCLTEVNRINAIVDQLLLLARFESQKQLIKNEPLNINALLYDITARYSQIITDKSINVEYHLKDEVYINSDEYLFSIILDNIISNAVKYTPSGKSITLTLEQADTKVTIIVADSGIGIPQEDLVKIFNPFFRSSTAKYGNTAGTGIGLSIVKRLCELLQINITIISKIGAGTTVTLNLGQ
jgi:signal transduction histidine kinase